MDVGAGSIIVGGSICTSPLTITPAWPSPRSCPTSPALLQLLFFTLLWPITPLWVFAFAGCSPITAIATARALSARPACNSAFAITLRAPTHRAPTAKAERFIQTALREWVYACAYQDSEQRNAQMSPWLHHYNWHRPHASLNHAPPVSRSGLEQNNLLRLHS